MRLTGFHNTWTGSAARAQRWLAAFGYYYNFQRPNQALDGRTPVEEVLNRLLDSALSRDSVAPNHNFFVFVLSPVLYLRGYAVCRSE